MPAPSLPAHLSHHQRSTLRQIFQHPAGHNIEWRAVLSLLAAVGSAQERHDGKVAVTIGAQTEYFEPPRHKDISTQAVVNLRRMLAHTGYGAGAAKPPADQPAEPGPPGARVRIRQPVRHRATRAAMTRPVSRTLAADAAGRMLRGSRG